MQMAQLKETLIELYRVEQNRKSLSVYPGFVYLLLVGIYFNI
tara:strand:+ start:453 stop:578 length:126 start_codon:yes stop_codon:yes gene_type:complete